MSDASIAIGIGLLIVGVVLLVMEFVHPGVFVLIPGTIFTTAGVIYLIAPDVLLNSILGPVLVAGFALLSAVVSFFWYQRIAPSHPPVVTTPETLAGLEGIVIAPVVPDSLSGKVRVRSEVWSARSNVPIPVGAKVRIVGGEGVGVNVIPLNGSSATAA